MKNIEIVDAEYKDGYNIFIKFNDGKSGIVNLENILWGKVFEPLKDVLHFKNFEISKISNTIEWKNGADLAPEFLYNLI
ncbi:MAG: DUF2442 domain-containing protein [Candidatus Kapabacteria bacterium]|jgi:hypothetical protein|nr:DUF2442 domain-containing protein [Candidatus Kapabacteria bacterium]